ncbi:MAG: hypothetical protein ACI8PZ_001275 [Myxococcota bacterium]|jgi:hypothetical protein
MQDATVRPEPTLQRKAAITTGRAQDHAGKVRVEPIPDFDLDRTIFKTLEGAVPRYVMRSRIAKEPHWDGAPAAEINQAYAAVAQTAPLPDVDPALLQFMAEECDFDVEHADGSFLDHLYFCFEYTARHFPGHSPIVMLLHSILGTGTNTFAMTADKIDALRAHLSPFEWAHIEAFPSVLRLLYDLPLRQELRREQHRLDQLLRIDFHRVIDDAPITLTADELWVQLNFQLIHLVDFLPVANWGTHANETAFLVFRDLHDLLTQTGRLTATVGAGPVGGRGLERETLPGLRARLATRIPLSVSERMAARSVRQFSDRVGHSMAYTLSWG